MANGLIICKTVCHCKGIVDFVTPYGKETLDTDVSVKCSSLCGFRGEGIVLGRTEWILSVGCCEFRKESGHAGPLSLAGTATNIIFIAAKVLPRLTRVCRDKIRLLSRQNILLSRKTYFCRDKHILVATKLLLRQAYFCRDKSMLIATNLILSRQKFCRDKSFVATKMILVAAAANDRRQGSSSPSSRDWTSSLAVNNCTLVIRTSSRYLCFHTPCVHRPYKLRGGECR